ncbi:MAG: hypothetical protein JXD18_09900 [Anaerolineae bacterium]|nr:hypothetical protein [Anaerolineae bacterium]
MRKGIAVLLISFLACLLTAGWVPLPQAGTVTVTGQVANGTPDGANPAGLPVTLRAFTDMEDMSVYTATLSADGTFAFADVSLEPGMTLVAQITYQDVAYASEFLTLEEGQSALDVPITIYDATEDAADLTITQLHMFMVPMGDGFQVSEYYLVSNVGERAYVGTTDPDSGRRLTLFFTLPEGAENLRFDGLGLGERFVEVEGGFADTLPVAPGMATFEVLFTYELPFEVGMQVERPFDLPVSSVVMLVNEAGVGLQGEGIFSEGVMDTQMGMTRSYTAGPFLPGQALVFTLVEEAAPAVSAPVSTGSSTPLARNSTREIGIGLAALVAAAVAAYAIWRTPDHGPVPAAVHAQVEAIARLDADFEAGAITEKVYRKKRSALKREIRGVLTGSEEA